MEQDSHAQRLIKWILGITGLGAVAATFTIRPYGIWIGLIILLLLVLLVGGYFLWRAWQGKREQQQFTRAVEQQTAVAPRAISDPGKRARLDDLRRRFQEGINVYNSRGKDLYKLPWYVLIGESGSGKTEAVRHSNIGFPPGMQDEFQGAGGTVNMHWWFTNHGVILDTAGRLMFEEVKAGESSEWKEFLKLLKKTRPLCPINGLFLVLPVDSLIKDSADRIAQKAGHIAQQLDVIQRTLDIRFPVYVLVTKCDLMTGFREFFDGIEDPQMQHQMFGWSNPDPLDAPFRPDLVDQHLTQVTQKLRRRRLGHLRDPVATGDAGGRRTDEVDALFALPQSLLLIAPRLRRYLETIFVAGEWSAKPVFLRGIYLTSSMREGSDLDEALAQALGIPVTELPGGRVWEKDRAFFLRDLFIEKAFRERGLVTNASNTRRLLQQRRLALMGCGCAALAFLGLFSWLGWRSLQQNVRSESAKWQLATNGWSTITRNDTPVDVWNPIVQPVPAVPGVFSNVTAVAGNPKVELARFHSDLKSLATNKLSISFVFRPIVGIKSILRRDLTSERKKAQRILFERSVLFPMVLQTRQKMMAEGGSNAAGAAVAPDVEAKDRQAQALASLVQLEADRVLKQETFQNNAESRGRAERYLASFLNYLTETNRPPDTNLVEVFAWTYSAEGGGKDLWPSKVLTEGDSLSSNRPIQQGLERLKQNFQGNQTALKGQLAVLDRIRLLSLDFQQQETLLNQAAENQASIPASQLEALTSSKSNLDTKITEARNTGLFPEGACSLATGYSNLLAHNKQTAQKSLASVYAALPDATASSAVRLFAEIREKLDDLERSTARDIEKSYRATGNLADLDACYLADYDKTTRNYAFRWDLYRRSFDLKNSGGINVSNLVGQEWKTFQEMQATLQAIKNQAEGYKGCNDKALLRTCRFLLEEADKSLQEDLIKRYLAFTAQQLDGFQGLAAGQVDFGFLQIARGFLVKVDRDLAEGALVRVPANQRSLLASLPAKVGEAKKALIAKYAQREIAQLKGQLGFPVVFDETTRVLDRAELAEFRKSLGQIQTNLVELAGFFPEPPPALKSLFESSSDIVNALVGPDGTPFSSRVQILPNENDLLTIGRFRYLRLETGPANIPVDITKQQDFGPLALDKPLKIEIRRFPADTTLVNQNDDFAQWGVVGLIRKYAAQAFRSPDGLKWKVPVAVSDGQKQGVVNLELVLDRPWPSLDKWKQITGKN